MTDSERLEAIDAARPRHVTAFASDLAGRILSDIEDEPIDEQHYYLARWIVAILNHAEQQKEPER